MEDMQLIIYIIFGIIYLIFGALKKRRQNQHKTPPLFEDEEQEVLTSERAERHREVEAVPRDQREPGSIEELLERYEEAANRAKRRAASKAEPMKEQTQAELEPAVKNQPVYQNLEAEALEQMQRTEHLKSIQESLPAKARAEVLSKQPSAIEAPSRLAPSRLQTQGGSPRKKKLQRKSHIARPMTPAQHIGNLLRTRNGLKQAVVLTEILNRKHF